MATPIKYKKVKVIRISEVQDSTLKKMKSYKINVASFIRDAISEKLQREKHEILKPKPEYCPFSNNSIIINKV
jgi:post-segregation antitoxin (ccd killing protein)